MHIHNMGYRLPIKMNEVMIHATAWRDFETLCKMKEVRQKSTCCMITLYEISLKDKFIET